MTDRQQIAELPPCHGAFMEISPVRLQAIAALAGASAGPFRRVLVLECGTGLGPAILAAALAGLGAEIWGATPDTEDADLARALIERSGVSARILTAGYAELAQSKDLPQLDLVALPWGWDAMSDRDRAHLQSLLLHRLAPGGGFLRFATVSEFGAEPFLRRLAANRWEAAPGDLGIEARVRWTLEAMADMFVQSHLMVRNAPDWEEHLDHLRALPPRTFARMWPRPAARKSTIREERDWFVGAGLSRWVPADATRLAQDLDLTDSQAAITDAVADPWLRAETADLLSSRARRADLFLKPGGAPADPAAVRLRLAHAPDGEIEITGLLGRTTLSNHAYRPLIGLLREDRAATIGEIAAGVAAPVQGIIKRVAVLIGAGVAAPAAFRSAEDVPSEAREACARINSILAEQGWSLFAASALSGGPSQREARVRRKLKTS